MTRDVSSKVSVFSPDSNPYGVSYADWTSRWWQWILSIPAEINPAKDNTGKNCDVNQVGPVWYLAGTMGGVTERTCTIPSGLAILLPVLNHGGTLADDPSIKSDEELQQLAIREMDVISNLEVTVDRTRVIELNSFRVRSPTFDVVLPPTQALRSKACR